MGEIEIYNAINANIGLKARLLNVSIERDFLTGTDMLGIEILSLVEDYSHNIKLLRALNIKPIVNGGFVSVPETETKHIEFFITRPIPKDEYQEMSTLDAGKGLS